jgi:ribulose-phosphate 3-epimerase
LAASILSADFARLGEDSELVLKAGADWIHFDVMDNHFVPNLTVGAMVCKALRNYGITAPIDVHLMAQPVDSLIANFAQAGADYITFHPEASENVEKSIQLINDLGCKAGLAFNPDKPLTNLESFASQLDIILIMSVFPGFGGQKFISEVLPKITEARNIIDWQEKEIWLEVDGGINTITVNSVANAGANVFVAGSAIFGDKNYAEAINKLKHQYYHRGQQRP